MKMKHRIICISDEWKELVLDIEGKEYEILQMFMNTDVIQFGEWIICEFDNVLSGKYEHKKISGNLCSVEITPVKTKIENLFSEDDSNFEINTEDLAKMIYDWNAIYQEFKHTRDR